MPIANSMESDTMEKILIVPNPYKDKNLMITRQIIDFLLERGQQIFLPQDYTGYELVNQYCIQQEEELHAIDFGIVLGGDGTIIRASRKYLNYHFPVLGINLGNLGFLAEIELENINEALESVLAGKFSIEERMLIQATFYGGDQIGLALNDIVITRQSISRMINFDVYVNDAFVNNYRADGVIISTPTGSTAYNLSAGGPIISPNNEVIVLTPICSHSLNARSIVLSGNDHIKLTFEHPKNEHVNDLIVTIDGQEVANILKEDTLMIKKASKKVRLMLLNDKNFYDILRKKLY
jgi:NAD+ kinase